VSVSLLNAAAINAHRFSSILFLTQLGGGTSATSRSGSATPLRRVSKTVVAVALVVRVVSHGVPDRGVVSVVPEFVESETGCVDVADDQRLRLG
jgi:hypothetical protein